MEKVVFLFFAIVSVVFALTVIFAKKPIYSVLSLVVVMIAFSGLYVLLSAEFVAVIQVLLYAGGVMVLFLFVIMLLNMRQDIETMRLDIRRLLGFAFGGVLIIEFVITIFSFSFPNKSHIYGGIKEIARVMFHKYLVPFELLSIFLLVGILGSIAIIKRERDV
jgi:NADH-quinone oxidoreductase subunit J